VACQNLTLKMLRVLIKRSVMMTVKTQERREAMLDSSQERTTLRQSRCLVQKTMTRMTT